MRELNLYRRRLRIVRGKGVYIWDDEGRRYLDAIAGIGVAVLGHTHEEFSSAMREQMDKLVVAGPMFNHEEKDQAIEELSRFSKFEHVYFCNSGTEAVEAALKFARLETGKKEVVAMTGAFHGRTFGSLSATWRRRYREGFEPLVPGFRHIPFNDVEAAKEGITGETAAVILEPIQGEGGVIPAREEFVRTLRDVTEDKGVLLIADEVQSGLRTGKFMALEHYGVQADIVAMGKGIANGVPIGLTLLNFDVPRSKHGSTFGGNPLSCRALATTLRILRRDGLMEKALDKWIDVQGRDVILTRGRGLMIGVLLRKDAWSYVLKLQQRGLLVNTAGRRVIRLLPPLIITKEQMSWIKGLMEDVLQEDEERRS